MVTDKFASQRKKLAEDIKRFSAKIPAACKSVGITLRYPTHSDLTVDQLEYYTYWKSTVGTRSFRKTADGYCWLLVCELINSPDTGRSSFLLNSLVGCGTGSPIYPELLPTAIEYSDLHGTPMPAFEPWMDELGITMQYILDSPVSDIPGRMIAKYSGRPAGADTCRTIGTILRNYDELLRADGKTLRSLVMDCRKRAYHPFSDFVLLGRKTPVETTEWTVSEDRFADLISFITDIIATGERSRADPPCEDGLVAIIDEVRRTGRVTDSPDPFTKRSRSFRLLGTSPTSLGPSCLEDPLAPDRSGTRITLGDILTFSGRREPGSGDFITSDYEHPTYNDLSHGQFSYYRRWRNSFLDGTCMDTDNGYVNLFINELINSDDTGRARRILERLLKSYGRKASIGAALTDHCILNGYPLPDHRVYTDRLTINNWIGRFIEGTNEEPLDEYTLNIMRTGSANVRFAGYDIPMEPLEVALRRILRAISQKKDLFATLSVDEVCAKRSIYFGLDYMRGPKEVTVRFRNYIGSRKFVNLVDKIVRYASELNEAHLEGTGMAKKPFSNNGVNCASIIYEEFLVTWATRSRPADIRLDLDMDAVRSAESDLAEVTEMMRTEVPPEEDVAETVKAGVAPEPRTDDPWADLFDSLSASERKYLRMCIGSEPTASFLRSEGTTKVKMEDGINAKALDTVGDTVIEDGMPIEDYMKELEKRL